MVTTKNLAYGYPQNQLLRFPDLSVNQSGSVLITGASGKGKTTLLHLLAGILRPHHGSVTINGTDLAQLSERKLDKFRGAHIGLILQQPHFIESLSVLENIETAAYFATDKKNSARAKELLESLGLAAEMHRKAAQLSVGQQQRASVARALINKPALLLADEPTSSLDDKNASTVAAMLSGLAQQNNSALVIVTHDKRLKDKFQNETAL